MCFILYLITGEVISGYAQKTRSFIKMINKLGLHQKCKVLVGYIDVDLFQGFILDALSKHTIFTLRAFLVKDNICNCFWYIQFFKILFVGCFHQKKLQRSSCAALSSIESQVWSLKSSFVHLKRTWFRLNPTAEGCQVNIPNNNFESRLGTQWEFICHVQRNKFFRHLYNTVTSKIFLQTLPKVHPVHCTMAQVFLLITTRISHLCVIDNPSFMNLNISLLNLLSWLIKFSGVCKPVKLAPLLYLQCVD